MSEPVPIETYEQLSLAEQGLGVAAWMKKNEQEDAAFRIKHDGVAIICQHQIMESTDQAQQMMKDGQAAWVMIYSIGQRKGMATCPPEPAVSNDDMQKEYLRVKKLFRL